MKTALGLYSLFLEYEANPEKTLKEIKKMGIDAIECYGNPVMPSEQFLKLLKDNELQLIGWHVEWELLQERTINQTIAYHVACQTPILFIPALGGPWEIGHTIEENNSSRWLVYAARMKLIRERLAAHGIALGYHTHDYDFGELLDNGKTSVEILMEKAPQDLQIEVDTGNCIEASKDPIFYLEALQDQAKYLHCKPFSLKSGYNVALGATDDENSWLEILSHCKKVDYLVLETEQRQESQNQFEIVQKDFQQLEKLRRQVTSTNQI
ncbi:sugar phosphate isomerase/epimerase family protein [Enterococcus sp.]|uniref:sugar phosphate isomerase/epimerase family protein n=1 Tax=Enterococcus sp. TaxID=35783 RepID=UPI003C7765F7